MTSRLVGTSSSTRTLDQRDLAALRPMPAPRPRASRKQPERRAVANGIVCFCGERFAESQALEFMLHLRAEVGEVLMWRDRQRAYFLKRNKRPETYEYIREYVRRPEVRERRRAYLQRPEVAERRRERQRGYNHQWRMQRQQEDPEWRERENAKARERYARRKAEREKAGS